MHLLYVLARYKVGSMRRPCNDLDSQWTVGRCGGDGGGGLVFSFGIQANGHHSFISLASVVLLQ